MAVMGFGCLVAEKLRKRKGKKIFRGLVEKLNSSVLQSEELSFLVVSFPNFSQKSNGALRNLNKFYGFCFA